MDKQYFKKLLEKYINGEARMEERQFLESYYNLFENEQDCLNSLTEDEKKNLQEEISAKIWNNIDLKNREGSKIKSIYQTLKYVAAASVIIGIVGILYFYYNQSKDIHESNLTIQRNYDNSESNVNTLISLHQKENKVIFLPDGSTVYLSPGSRLNYPSTFDGLNKREVYLQGQGYFDIKHNASRPFIVHTGKVETTVLGTAFNIKAQPDEQYITVTVKRGRVSVSDPHKTLAIIKPQEQVIYNTNKQTSTLSKVTDDSYLDWKNRDLFIDNLTIEEAAKLLEEQYKIKIIIKDSSIKEQRFTATLTRKESVEVAVKSISEFNGFLYSFNKDKSIVTIYNIK